MGTKLLVADDSLTIQKVIRLALSSSSPANAGEGYEIQAVSDGNDAVQQISLFRPDVVLIDVSLPGQNAFQLKRAVNEMPDLAGVRFVLMSSAFEKVDEQQAAEVVFHGRLTKPFDPAHLREVLHQVRQQAEARRQEPTVVIQRSISEPPREIPSIPPPAAEEPTLDLPRADSSIMRLRDAPSPPPPAIPAATWPEHELDFQPPPPPPLPDDFSLEPPAPPSTPVSAPPQIPKEEPIMPLMPVEEESPLLAEAPPEPPMQSAPTSGGPDSDIRHLTESTIRMSGLDDFQWSVQEPSMKPLPGLTTPENLTFPRGDDRASAYQQAIHRGNILETAPAEMPIAPPSPPAATPAAAPTRSAVSAAAAMSAAIPAPSRIAPTPTPAPEPEPVMMSQQEMEQIIRDEVAKEVEKVVRKMIQERIPQIAEKILKDEIHRMLSEQP